MTAMTNEVSKRHGAFGINELPDDQATRCEHPGCDEYAFRICMDGIWGYLCPVHVEQWAWMLLDYSIEWRSAHTHVPS